MDIGGMVYAIDEVVAAAYAFVKKDEVVAATSRYEEKL